MGTKSKALKQKIKFQKVLLNLLLKFRQPTDKIVVLCSQQLDKSIVDYQRVKYLKYTLTKKQIA